MITCVEPVGAVRGGVPLARLGPVRARDCASGFSAEGVVARGGRQVAVIATRKV